MTFYLPDDAVAEFIISNITAVLAGAVISMNLYAIIHSKGLKAAENALVRTYSNDIKDKGRRIRLERQEYPKKSFADAIEEKLNSWTRTDTK